MIRIPELTLQKSVVGPGLHRQATPEVVLPTADRGDAGRPLTVGHQFRVEAVIRRRNQPSPEHQGGAKFSEVSDAPKVGHLELAARLTAIQVLVVGRGVPQGRLAPFGDLVIPAFGLVTAGGLVNRILTVLKQV